MRRIAALLAILAVTATSLSARAFWFGRWDLTGPKGVLGLAGAAMQLGYAERAASQTAILASDSFVALDGFGEAELELLVRYDLEALGAISVGQPNRGALLNPVQLPWNPLWRVVEQESAWTTPETADALARSIGAVHAELPGAHPIDIGHISGPRGGYLKPHRSHQSGRDVDLGYYYLDGPEWYKRVTENNLDRARTWLLVKALVLEGNAEYIFVDRTVQRLLRGYAEIIGEDPRWLDRIFQRRRRQPGAVIRHTWGHSTHLHVRFRNPIAEERGKRVYRQLVRHRLIAPRRYY